MTLLVPLMKTPVVQSQSRPIGLRSEEVSEPAGFEIAAECPGSVTEDAHDFY